MKQMTLIEMDGFLKGKCFPRDLKVNETNAEYLVRKFGELESKIALLEVQLKLSEAAERAWESLMMQACGEDGPKSVADKFAEIESKLETALRECRSAGITIDNLEAKCAALSAELSAIEAIHNDAVFITDAHYDQCHPEVQKIIGALAVLQIPAYQDFLAEVRAQGLNAFIQHRSAELDAHIKNGGEQFDEKSVRIRDIIVSARLFREQIRKEAAQ